MPAGIIIGLLIGLPLGASLSALALGWLLLAGRITTLDLAEVCDRLIAIDSEPTESIERGRTL